MLKKLIRKIDIWHYTYLRKKILKLTVRIETRGKQDGKR